MLQVSRRCITTSTSCFNKKALILGVKSTNQEKEHKLYDENKYPHGTSMYKYHDEQLRGKITKLLKLNKPLKAGQARTFFDEFDDYNAVTVVGIGSDEDENGMDNLECVDKKKESIRLGIAAGMHQLKDSGIDEVLIDPANAPQAAAESAYLSSWSYKEKERKKYPNIAEHTDNVDGDLWKKGRILAESQNWSRHLMDSPANQMTPSIFAQNLEETFCACDTLGELKVNIKSRDWIAKEKMGAFLSVAQGSDQEPKFAEVHYEGPNVTKDLRPLVLVGKGVTFDSGGVSIKPSQGMDEMRGDMGGAATMAGAMLAAARMNVKGKVIGLFPLCENLINGKATKPGDVVTARNGTTIQVDNTDAEGRLLLADALSYGQDFNPRAIIDAATLTGAIAVALGSGASAVYANNNGLWKLFNEAGCSTGDRVWRMPLFHHYSTQVKPSHLADINNIGKGGRWGGSCTAAAFLRHFIKPKTSWAHLDIAGVMTSNGKDLPYLCQGMSGRPTRTIAQFIVDFCNDSVS